MLRRNLDVTRGLVNSAIGTVMSVKRNIDCNSEVNFVTVSFANGVVHDLERMKTKFQILDKAFIYREQFPITVSYGITIHKSQGLSLKNVVMDIGESVFTCGQTYVALSRVTSLDGVHLINFNPADVKAQNSAINEYNRLRAVFRPDLPQLDIIDHQHSNQYVRDRKWSTNKGADEVQISNLLYVLPTTDEQVFNGFSNLDGVSCYANAVIQCLYNSEKISNIIRSDDSIPEQLKDNLYRYKRKEVVDTISIRRSIADVYGETQQQDCVQFLEDIINKCPSILNIMRYVQRHTIICHNCEYISQNEIQETIVRLPLEDTSATLTDLFNSSYGRWQPVTDYTCRSCRFQGTARQKFEITSAQDYLAFQMLLFTKQLTKINYFKCNGVPTTKICISDKIYKPESAVFHYGQTLYAGHYKACIKTKCNWICANDDHLQQIRWPVGARNMYLIIMAKEQRRITAKT